MVGIFLRKIRIRRYYITEFEIDAIFNTICRPGRVVKILTKNGKEENVPVRV